MSLTPSTMVPLGTSAPAFSLPSTDGETVSLDTFADSDALLVMFICNHCPYVIHVAEELTRLGNDYQSKGVSVVAINANDVASYPDDSPDKMVQFAKDYGFTFPYLYDETQEVARAYRAACTPDFFLYDKQRKLYYRGQLDRSRPGNNTPVAGEDLRAVLDAVLAGGEPPAEQTPSLGCNIKWKPGNEPDFAR